MDYERIRKTRERRAGVAKLDAKKRVERRRVRQRQERERREAMQRKKCRVTVTVIFCICFIAALCALNFVVKHAHEFKNVHGAEAAGLSDDEKSSFSEGEVKVEDSDDGWELTLVNKDHAVPEDYEIELTTLSNGQQVDSRMYPHLQDMFDDMRSEGLRPVVVSGYRTPQYQRQLMDEEVLKFLNQGYSQPEAEEQARGWVAVPGRSEHHLGLAVDINEEVDENNPADSSTSDAVYQWLNANAYRYGFILRYPSGKESITGVNYEPWHYRYVGVENATEIYNSGLTLEEYLDK